MSARLGYNKKRRYMNKTYYITTTLPYVNADPHIGFALEIVQADVIARLKKIEGREVIFNTGTDEHGQKIYTKAQEQGKDPQKYVDEYAAKFDDLKDSLNLTYTNFLRTSSDSHKRAAQEIWRLCEKNGYIEKGIYKAKYCVGCELEKTDSELVDERCPLHPTQELETIEEENYFFKFSKLQEKLLAHYRDNPQFVVPPYRLTEIRNFVKAGLRDFSISRLKKKMPWGVPVPGDESHVMYVWFDALTSYISTLGWPESGKFEDFWGSVGHPNAVQVAGKDNLRQQSAMWQAMLLAAGLPLSKQIIIHGFINSDGQKMSKSLGNVVNPIVYVDKYGTDALRYFLLAKVHPFEDSDFTRDKFEEAYTADLANGLGNLVSRVEAMSENLSLEGFEKRENNNSLVHEVTTQLDNYRFDEALRLVWSAIAGLDKYINKERVWKLKLSEGNQKLSEIVVGTTARNGIFEIAEALAPFLPDTSHEIIKRFSAKKIIKGQALFPRLQ